VARQLEWIGYFAPRISQRLRAEIERLANRPLSAAEITRNVGNTAERLGLRRPSYEQVRVLVRGFQARPVRHTTGQVMLDVVFRVRPVDALLDHQAGISTPGRHK
jgi:hypothetical protein